MSRLGSSARSGDGDDVRVGGGRCGAVAHFAFAGYRVAFESLSIFAPWLSVPGSFCRAKEERALDR